MFKASLLRHSRLGHAVARRQISALSSTRSLRFQTLEQHTSRLSQSAGAQSVSLRCLSQRLYSSESAAAAQTYDDAGPASKPELITRFADLSKLGVHPRLVEAITLGMKYETMTDVQSKTINAALNGVDLYVHALFSAFCPFANMMCLQCRTSKDRHRKDSGLFSSCASTTVSHRA